MSTECTTTSQPQSLAISRIASDITRISCSQKQMWPFLMATGITTHKCSVTAKTRNHFHTVNESQTSGFKTMHSG